MHGGAAANVYVNTWMPGVATEGLNWPDTTFAPASVHYAPCGGENLPTR
jgi:hypothetical protein